MKNTIQKSILLAAILCTAGLIGCTSATSSETAKNAEKPATNEKNTETTKSVLPPAEPATETADQIGVPECDEYIEKYEICIMSKAPEAQRAMLESTFKQSRQSWKQAAASPQSKAALPNACKQALEIAKQTTTVYGCVW